MDKMVFSARRLAAESEAECLMIQKELKEIGIHCEIGVADRAVPAMWVSEMGKQEIEALKKECERGFWTIMSTRGWNLSINRSRENIGSIEQLVGKLAVLRTRLGQLTPPRPSARALAEQDQDLVQLQKLQQAPIEVEDTESHHDEQISPQLPVEYSDLQVGDLAQVCILSGKWAGNWVDCDIHSRMGNGQMFDIHVLRTNKYDSAVGQSGRIVEGVSSRYLRPKTTQRVKVGSRYLSPDVNGDIWPVTILSENTDGTYTVQVHDGSFERQWRRVDEENILCPEPPRVPSPRPTNYRHPQEDTFQPDSYVSPNPVRPSPFAPREEITERIEAPVSHSSSRVSQRSPVLKTDFGVQFTGVSEPSLSTPSSSAFSSRPPPPPTSPDVNEHSERVAEEGSPASKKNTAITLDTDVVELSSCGTRPPSVQNSSFIDAGNEVPSAGSPASKKNTAITLDTDEVELSSCGSRPPPPTPVSEPSAMLPPGDEAASPGSPASKKNTAIALDTDEINLDDL